MFCYKDKTYCTRGLNRWDGKTQTPCTNLDCYRHPAELINNIDNLPEAFSTFEDCKDFTSAPNPEYPLSIQERV